MKTILQKILCNKKGFSLIELIVVVVIMAMLAAVAIPIYNNNQLDAYAPEGEAVLYAGSMGAMRYRTYNTDFNGITWAILSASPYNVQDTTACWNFSLSPDPNDTADDLTIVASSDFANANCAAPDSWDAQTISFKFIVVPATGEQNVEKTYSW